MITKEVWSYVLCGTKTQIDEMIDLMDNESYDTASFHKYFYVWNNERTGIHYFPKEKYFVSKDGETNYAVALLRYGSKCQDELTGC